MQTGKRNAVTGDQFKSLRSAPSNEPFKPHALKVAEAARDRVLKEGDEFEDEAHREGKRMAEIQQWRHQVVDLHRVISVSQAMWLLLEHNNEALLRVAIEIITCPVVQKVLWWDERWYHSDEDREWFRKQVKGKLAMIMNSMQIPLPVEEEKDEHDEAHEEFLKKMEAMEKRCAAAEKGQQNAELRLRDVEQALQEAKGHAKTLEKSLDKMREELRTAQAEAESNASKAPTAKLSDLEQSEQKVRFLEENKKAIEDKLAKLEAELKDTVPKAQLSDMQGKLGEAQGKIKQLESEVRQLTKRLELEQQRPREKAPAAPVPQAAAAEPVVQVQIQKEIVEVEKIVVDHTAEEELKRALDEVQQRAVEFQAEAERQKSKVSELDAENARLKAEIEALKADSDLAAENSELREKIAQLERELAHYKKKTGTLQQQKADLEQQLANERDKPPQVKEVIKTVVETVAAPPTRKVEAPPPPAPEKSPRPVKKGIDEEEHAKVVEKLQKARERIDRLVKENLELKEERDALEARCMKLLRMLHQIKEQLKRVSELAEKKGMGKMVQSILEEANVSQTLESAEYTAFDRLYDDAKRRQERNRIISEMGTGGRAKSALEEFDRRTSTSGAPGTRRATLNRASTTHSLINPDAGSLEQLARPEDDGVAESSSASSGTTATMPAAAPFLAATAPMVAPKVHVPQSNASTFSMSAPAVTNVQFLAPPRETGARRGRSPAKVKKDPFPPGMLAIQGSGLADEPEEEFVGGYRMAPMQGRSPSHDGRHSKSPEGHKAASGVSFGVQEFHGGRRQVSNAIGNRPPIRGGRFSPSPEPHKGAPISFIPVDDGQRSASLAGRSPMQDNRHVQHQAGHQAGQRAAPTTSFPLHDAKQSPSRREPPAEPSRLPMHDGRQTSSPSEQAEPTRPPTHDGRQSANEAGQAPLRSAIQCSSPAGQAAQFPSQAGQTAAPIRPASQSSRQSSSMMGHAPGRPAMHTRPPSHDGRQSPSTVEQGVGLAIQSSGLAGQAIQFPSEAGQTAAPKRPASQSSRQSTSSTGQAPGRPAVQSSSPAGQVVQYSSETGQTAAPLKPAIHSSTPAAQAIPIRNPSVPHRGAARRPNSQSSIRRGEPTGDDHRLLNGSGSRPSGVMKPGLTVRGSLHRQQSEAGSDDGDNLRREFRCQMPDFIIGHASPDKRAAQARMAGSQSAPTLNGKVVVTALELDLPGTRETDSPKRRLGQSKSAGNMPKKDEVVDDLHNIHDEKPGMGAIQSRFRGNKVSGKMSSMFNSVASAVASKKQMATPNLLSLGQKKLMIAGGGARPVSVNGQTSGWTTGWETAPAAQANDFPAAKDL